ncbi:Sua5/YciO/YrdC/YwlC family protein [Sphaerochaeta halotolerans]|jgi:L-threonylcarbamoyladenylate synthase|uniref:L-threonylcarbamoyladenylate synthase n=1 Tax=Sphaerochaeta halotolerans TaxID=2293840 RepID=A0A372MFY9_9SPIR|nr:Sua5/YciO/YrdC/YwlC family protein [Sphaerochaeta halotolerans]RFU94654.1 Sua5/YciO/YrdC/YwlC family protein [Sphaerochaeta halotolerans]
MSRTSEEAELLYKSEPDTLDRCVIHLQEDNLMILPCDTIYGLSGKVDTTLQKLRALKEHIGQQQFAILSTLEQAHQLCIVPEVLQDHWPCALTCILPNRKGEGSSAVRVPDDPFIQELLTRLGSPIYSTAVNPNEYFITNITDIIFTYKEKVQAIVVDPKRQRNTPSTLIDCTTTPYTLLRCGDYDASSLLL